MGKQMAMRRWQLGLGECQNSSHLKLDSPPGYDKASQDTGEGTVKKKHEEKDLKEKMAMETAQGQGKSLMMNMFMMWMAGNSLHIFPIMMVGMAIWTPIGAIMNMKNAFRSFEGPDSNLILPKLIYAAIHLAGISAGIYKCSNLGLVPNQAADWLVQEGIKPAIEFSGGGMSM